MSEHKICLCCVAKKYHLVEIYDKLKSVGNFWISAIYQGLSVNVL